MRSREEQKSVFDNQIKSAAPPNPAGLVPGADDLMPTDNNKRNNICNNNKRRSVLRHYCARSEPVISLRCLSVSLAGSQWTGINLICILNRQREGAIPSFHSPKTRDESVAASFAYVSIFTEGKQAANFFFFFIWPPVSIALGSHALSDVKLIVLVGQEARRLRMAVINGRQGACGSMAAPMKRP